MNQYLWIFLSTASERADKAEILLSEHCMNVPRFTTMAEWP